MLEAARANRPCSRKGSNLVDCGNVMGEKKRMVELLKIDHFKLNVRNLDKVSNFYIDKLGFDKVVSMEGYIMLRHDEIFIDLAVPEGIETLNDPKIEVPSTDTRWGNLPGLVHVAFKVYDVHKAFKELQDNAVEFHVEPFFNPKNKRTIAFFKDPEGNILHLTD